MSQATCFLLGFTAICAGLWASQRHRLQGLPAVADDDMDVVGPSPMTSPMGSFTSSMASLSPGSAAPTPTHWRGSERGNLDFPDSPARTAAEAAGPVIHSPAGDPSAGRPQSPAPVAGDIPDAEHAESSEAGENLAPLPRFGTVTPTAMHVRESGVKNEASPRFGQPVLGAPVARQRLSGTSQPMFLSPPHVPQQSPRSASPRSAAVSVEISSYNAHVGSWRHIPKPWYRDALFMLLCGVLAHIVCLTWLADLSSVRIQRLFAPVGALDLCSRSGFHSTAVSPAGSVSEIDQSSLVVCAQHLRLHSRLSVYCPFPPDLSDDTYGLPPLTGQTAYSMCLDPSSLPGSMMEFRLLLTMYVLCTFAVFTSVLRGGAPPDLAIPSAPSDGKSSSVNTPRPVASPRFVRPGPYGPSGAYGLGASPSLPTLSSTRSEGSPRNALPVLSGPPMSTSQLPARRSISMQYPIGV